MQFPDEGRAPEELLGELEALKVHDVAWADGRVFSYIYAAGPAAMAEQVHAASRSVLP